LTYFEKLGMRGLSMPYFKKNPFFILHFTFFIAFSSCWLNPNAPANVFECNKGNVQGEDLAKCKKEVKNLFLMSLAALSGGGGGTVKVTEYVYTGTLTDSTGQPLSNTVIKSEPPGLEGTTDANGNYQFTGSPGTYTVTVYNSDGSESGKLQVDISSGGQTTVVVINGDVTMNVSVGTPTVSNLKLSIPTFNPESGNYSTAQTVSLSTITEGSKIYYTVDNTEPTVSSTLYTEPITVSQSTTIKAIATKDGYTDSDIVSSFYGIIEPTPGVPSSTTKDITTFYFSNPAVIGSITGTNISLTVPYGTLLTSLIPTVTHNGNSINPASGVSQNFSSPVTYTVTAQDGTTQSYTVTVTTAASTQVATPTFTPSTGTYNPSQSITITCSTTNATIFYTVDGSEPNLNSTRYTTAVSLADKGGTTFTLKAIAYKNNMTQSTVASVTYTVTQTVATPTFSPTPGTFLFSNNPTIIISTTTTDATIYYTTDGTNPTTSSSQFVAGISLITVAEYLKIKTYAVKSSWTDSAIASGDYYLISPLLKTVQSTCSSGASGDGAMVACPQTITGQDGDYQKGTTRSYTDNGNGTIIDNVTGLIWQKCSMGFNNDVGCTDDGDTNNNTATWANAITYCENLTLGGSSDWRLPGIKQLRSLVDYSRYNPSINNLFPNTVANGYWSSSPSSAIPAMRG
jgi:hypothetical protein